MTMGGADADMGRERGSRDCRLLPAALVLWTAILAAEALFAILIKGEQPLAEWSGDGASCAPGWLMPVCMATGGFAVGVILSKRGMTFIRHLSLIHI